MNHNQQRFRFRHKPIVNSFDWNIQQPSLACLPWTPVPWTVHILSFSETWHKTSKHFNDHNSCWSLVMSSTFSSSDRNWFAVDDQPIIQKSVSRHRMTKQPFTMEETDASLDWTLCFPCSCQKGVKWIPFACILILFVLLTGSDSKEEWKRQDDADEQGLVQ